MATGGRYTFGFANLCGVSYKGTGNLLFAPGSDALLVPVGNRVSVFDCRAHASFTLDCQARSDIDVLALSPDGRLLLAVDTGACAREHSSCLPAFPTASFFSLFPPLFLIPLYSFLQMATQ